jgi:hypothetical protein
VHAPLQGAEVGTAGCVVGDELAVDHSDAIVQQWHQLEHLGLGRRHVSIAPGEQAHLGGDDIGDRTNAVSPHLKCPRVGLVVPQVAGHCQHGAGSGSSLIWPVPCGA